MKHCIIIPTYNTGHILKENVADVLEFFKEVIVVVDGSDDGSDDGLEELSSDLKILRLERNQGKGAAVLEALNYAETLGYTHALTMDADKQHPANMIENYMEISKQHPEAMVLGVPVFDETVPKIRKNGRKVSNTWANIVTLWWGVKDSLFGMRIYPIQPLQKAFGSTFGGRRFDFDPEMAIRLCWQGIPVINLPTAVRYLSAEEGGVSQFKYLRDNVLLTGMYIRLFVEFVVRLPILLWRLLTGGNPLKNEK